MDKKELKKEYGIEIWSDEKISSFRNTLLSWYDQEKRDLPWRRTKDPYRIWVSEIMLQQTRVDTVIPYYERFLTAFPTIKHLADSSEEECLKLWEGLGYYSRVRNMREAAQQIVANHNGIFPTELKEIKKLKGIGPYTSGAIASMAFNLPEPAVDGNLMRVLSRLFEIDVDIAKASNRKVFDAVMRLIIDPNRPGDFNQALMDLGATICTPKNYDPSISPIKEFNSSYLNETYEYYPVKSKKKKAVPVNYIGIVLKNENGEYLLEKRPPEGLLANMWTFPLINEMNLSSDQSWKSFEDHKIESLNNEEVSQLKQHISELYYLDTKVKDQTAGTITHIFSHLKWTVYLYETEVVKAGLDIPKHCEWVSSEFFSKYVFPTLQKKMWKEYQTITLF